MQEQPYMDDEIEIDLREIFFELLLHWKAIIASSVLMGLIAFVISFSIITPQYKSISELYVLSKSTSITSLADIQMGTNLTNDYMVVTEGRPVLEQVIANLGLDETYQSLREKIELNNPSDTRILQITVKDPDPEMAKVIADEIAEIAASFISEKMDQDAPTIIQYGYADGKPVEPETIKYTLVGIVAGLLSAVALIVISYLLNDTIINAEDVEQKLGLNLLGTLPFENGKSGNDRAKKEKRKKALAKKGRKR